MVRRITNDVGLRVGCIRGNDSAVGSTLVSLKTKRLAYKDTRSVGVVAKLEKEITTDFVK